MERFAEALAANDLDAQDALIHDDYVCNWPQSGEVVRGRANRRAIIEAYPESNGGLRPMTDRIVGSDDKFITGPPTAMWNMIHVKGSGDDLFASGTITYSNGEIWHYASVFTLREGKIWRQVDYFAPKFDAPGWRAPYTEREE